MNPSYFQPKPASAPASIALGCMNFGKRTNREDALRIVDLAVDAGIGLLDTANAYHRGESERIVGEALKRHPGLAVATKVGLGRFTGGAEGLHPDVIASACEDSLRRLNVDVIDLYYLHAPDADVPIAESIGMVQRLVDDGKVRHFGISNYAAWQALQMHSQLAPVVAQQLYNALIRQLDIEWFAFAKQFRTHTTIYNPLAGGLLTGKHHRDAKAAKGTRFHRNRMYCNRYWSDGMFDALDALTSIAKEEGVSLIDLAYAFVFAHPGVDSVLVGPATEEHLTAAVQARQLSLSEDAVRAVRDVYVRLTGTNASYVR